MFFDNLPLHKLRQNLCEQLYYQDCAIKNFHLLRYRRVLRSGLLSYNNKIYYH